MRYNKEKDIVIMKFSSKKIGALAILMLFATSVLAAEKGNWTSLFNGENIDGWIPKIRYYELGENYANTFRVEDGLLTVSYDGYKDFNNSFGHLFYKTPYSHYKIRMHYRFVGDQMHDGQGWALRNSGIMIHSQKPETMLKDQDFPVSVEVQLLGGGGKRERSTANMCSPGTHVEMDGKVMKRHCINSDSKTFHGDEWVKVEVEVLGNDMIKHYVNDELVMQYQRAQLDEKDRFAAPLLLNAGNDRMLSSGYISLQSESHPIQFKDIEIWVMDGT